MVLRADLVSAGEMHHVHRRHRLYCIITAIHPSESWRHPRILRRHLLADPFGWAHQKRANIDIYRNMNHSLISRCLHPAPKYCNVTCVSQDIPSSGWHLQHLSSSVQQTADRACKIMKRLRVKRVHVTETLAEPYMFLGFVGAVHAGLAARPPARPQGAG